MSLRSSLARVFLLAVLAAGAMFGVPMDPQKIRDLMELMHRTRVEYVVKKEDPP